MQLLNLLRDEESKIEQWQLKPIVQTYDLLATYDVRVTEEELDCVDAMSVKWGELVALARQTMQHLRRIGLTFRVMLLQNEGDFMAASVVFEEDYDRDGAGHQAGRRRGEAHGVPEAVQRGIKPSVAGEGLKAFQKHLWIAGRRCCGPRWTASGSRWASRTSPPAAGRCPRGPVTGRRTWSCDR